MPKRYGMNITSRGWNKAGLAAGRPEKKPRRVFAVKVTIYQGRKTAVRHITVDKLPIGRKKLYDVSVYYNKSSMDRRDYSSRHSVSTIIEVESLIVKSLRYFGGQVTPWEFRVQVLRKR